MREKELRREEENKLDQLAKLMKEKEDEVRREMDADKKRNGGTQSSLLPRMTGPGKGDNKEKKKTEDAEAMDTDIPICEDIGSDHEVDDKTKKRKAKEMESSTDSLSLIHI